MPIPVNKSVLLLLFISIIAVFSYCSTENNNASFAIRDFRKSLQPYLVEIVSNGTVGFDTAARYIESKATDEELQKLSKSEHPVLRALAFRAMLERPGFDHFAIIMNNLADTALVATDQGEWGIKYYRVADDIIVNGKWKDTVARLKTIEKLILHHNYLVSAYTALAKINPAERHYASIKQMAERSEPYEDGTGEIRLRDITFEEREYALVALAKYKKPGDIIIIKEKLLSNLWQATPSSFDIMEYYPYETGREVYEEYFAARFYRGICRDRTTNVAEGFINSVATFKNDHTAKILDSILNRRPLLPCPGDTNTIRRVTAYAIWNNDCKAYSKLRKQVAPLIKKYEAGWITIEPGPVISSPDTSAEPVHWWY